MCLQNSVKIHRIYRIFKNKVLLIKYRSSLQILIIKIQGYKLQNILHNLNLKSQYKLATINYRRKPRANSLKFKTLTRKIQSQEGLKLSQMTKTIFKSLYFRFMNRFQTMIFNQLFNQNKNNN